MNLAYRFPIMFWNCACLISDAGGADSEDEEIDEQAEEELKTEESYGNVIEDFNVDDDEVESSYEENEDCDGYPAEIIVTPSGKKKKKELQ